MNFPQNFDPHGLRSPVCANVVGCRGSLNRGVRIALSIGWNGRRSRVAGRPLSSAHLPSSQVFDRLGISAAVRLLEILSKRTSFFGESLPRKSEAAEAARSIGELFLDDRRWLDAEAAIELQINFGYSDAATFDSLGRAKGSDGRLDGAEQLFRRAMELDPKEPVYPCNLARVLKKARRWEEARAAYDQALALRPDYAPAVNGLALLHQERLSGPRSRGGRAAVPSRHGARSDRAGLSPQPGGFAAGRSPVGGGACCLRPGLGDRPGICPGSQRLGAAAQGASSVPRSHGGRAAVPSRHGARPDRAGLSRNLGDLLRDARRWEEARAVDDQALALDPAYAPAVNGLALLHKARRSSPDLAEAERLFRRAMELDPTEPVYPCNLGDLLRDARRWEEARAVYDQALAIDPGICPGSQRLGAAAQGASFVPRSRGGRAAVPSRHGARPDRAGLSPQPGGFAAGRSPVGGGACCLRPGLGDRPGICPGSQRLGAAAQERRSSPDLTEAERLFRRAMELDPTEPVYPRNLGDLLRDARRWEEARAVYDQALAIDRAYAPAVNGLALLHKERRSSPDLAEAERLFRRAMELDPTEPVYPRNLGDLLRDARRWEEARAVYDQALAIDPAYAPAVNGLALLHKERRSSPDLAEAERLFRRAMELDPTEPVCPRNLGDLLRDARRWEEARAVYDQALAIDPAYAPGSQRLGAAAPGAAFVPRSRGGRAAVPSAPWSSTRRSRPTPTTWGICCGTLAGGGGACCLRPGLGDRPGICPGSQRLGAAAPGAALLAPISRRPSGCSVRRHGARPDGAGLPPQPGGSPFRVRSGVRGGDGSQDGNRCRSLLVAILQPSCLAALPARGAPAGGARFGHASHQLRSRDARDFGSYRCRPLSAPEPFRWQEGSRRMDRTLSPRVFR